MLEAALVGFLLILTIYPDVVLNGATVSNYGQYSGAMYSAPYTELYPERPGRSYHHGLNDSGGAVWQSEPMQQFMAWVIRSGESPYWNRFSGAGSVGPETLIDQKFSPFTMLVAIGGGSTVAFHIAWILLNSLAIGAFYFTLVRYFKVGRMAALAGCVVYALNGYNVAQLSSNVSQAYLFFPPLLLALCAFAVRPTIQRFLVITGCCGLVLANTFLPTSLLTLVTVYAVALGFNISQSRLHQVPWKRYLPPVLGGQVGAFMMAFAMMAFLYLPIIESFSFLNSLSMYNQRVFYPASLNNLLALFTPKHYWESYNAINPELWNSKSLNYIGNVVFHFGIVRVAVSSAVVVSRFAWRTPLVYITLLILIVALGRVFDAPLISDLVGHLYMFGNIGEQYWWTVIAIVLPILVAFGFAEIGKVRSGWWPIISVFLVVVMCLVYTGLTYEIPEGSERISATYVAIAIAIITIGCALIYGVKNVTGRRGNYYRVALLVMVFAELTFYMNHYRFQRTDLFSEAPDDVQFLRENIGDYRIANYGYGGVPPEYGSAYQIAQIGSMNMNVIPSYLSFFQRVFLSDSTERWGQFVSLHNTRSVVPAERDVMLDMMGVKYVLISPAWIEQAEELRERGYEKAFETPYVVIFENKDVFPRVFAVSDVYKGELTPEAYGLSPRTAATTMDSVLLDAFQMQDDGFTIKQPVDDSNIVLEAYENSYIRVDVKLETPGLVLLMDNWHPNWTATIDGEKAYLGRVNESFRGVVMPAGEHVLEMHYTPRTLISGFIVSIFTLLSLLILAIKRRSLNHWLLRKTGVIG